MKSVDTILNKPIHRSFIHYVSLSLFSMLGLSLYILADTFFVANGVGQNGLTALNLVIPVYNILNGTGLMLGMGGATLYAIARGERSQKKANRIFSLTVVIGLLLGITITLFGLLFADPLLLFLGATDTTLPLAAGYFRTILIFALFFVVNDIMLLLFEMMAIPI